MAKLDKDIIKRNFDKAAHSYGENARLQRRVAHELVSRCKKFDGKVLDIGAGTGFISEITDWDLTGVDMSPEMCEVSGAICAEAENLPFEDASFDNIISSLTFQWIEDDVAAATEAYRVLKKGGELAISTFGKSTLLELKDAFSYIDGNEHIIEFAPSMKIFAAFKKAEFENLTINSQNITYLYDDIYSLLKSIKSIGASYPVGNSKGLKGKKYFEKLENIYRANHNIEGKLPVSWEVLYLTAVKNK